MTRMHTGPRARRIGAAARATAPAGTDAPGAKAARSSLTRRQPPPPQPFLPNDFIQPQAQLQLQDQQLQQDSTAILEANLRATQLEHDRLQQQIAALQSQQRQMANEQLQLQHFQLQQHQPQLTEASLGLQQPAPQGETKMASPVLGAITSAAGGTDGEVGNIPTAKSG